MAKATVRSEGEMIWVVAFVGLLVAIAVCGLKVADNANVMRGHYFKLGEVQREQDTLLAEHSRLLLERSSIASLQNIESIAHTDLDMLFPSSIEDVLR